MGRQQRLGIGVQRIAQQVCGGPLLRDLAEVKDGNAISDGLHGRDVVAGHHDRHAFLAQPGQQRQEIGRSGRIQVPRRLIEHEQARAGDHGTTEADKVQPSGSQFPRAQRQFSLGQAQPRCQRVHRCTAIRAARGVQLQRLLDQRPGRHAGIEHICGVAEHHRHAAAHAPQSTLRQCRDVATIQQHGAALAGDQAKETPRQRALSGTGFAHHREDLTLCHLEIDAVQGRHAVLAAAEHYGDAAKLGHHGGSLARVAHAAAIRAKWQRAACTPAPTKGGATRHRSVASAQRGR